MKRLIDDFRPDIVHVFAFTHLSPSILSAGGQEVNRGTGRDVQMEKL
jgi:hypothetical protein